MYCHADFADDADFFFAPFCGNEEKASGSKLNIGNYKRLRFHGMKHFVSYHETVRSKRRNTSFHPVNEPIRHKAFALAKVQGFALLVNEFGYFCIMISRKT